jgi:hypothetical protein
MHNASKDADSWISLPRAGGVAFAVQETWIENATIKVRSSLCMLDVTQPSQDNILFGSPYDKERYEKGCETSVPIFVLAIS